LERRLRLLLADDSDEMLAVIDELLRPEFEIVGQVKDGCAMLRAAREHSPDLIISDLDMPKMNGIQATIRLAESGPSVPVIILSIHNARELIHQALTAGAGGYVIKSDAGDELIEAVREVARGRKFLSRSCAYSI